MEGIKEAIKFLSKDGNEAQFVLCTVQSVDLTKKTCVCEPLSNGAELMDVKLMAKNQTGFYIIPEVDSQVIVCVQENLSYITMFSTVQEIQLNGDNYDGIPIIGTLVQKLNNLENAFNQFVILYNAHTHVETSTNTLVPSTLNTNVLINTTQTELENTTVLHGSGI
jgi:hypothetical protein